MRIAITRWLETAQQLRAVELGRSLMTRISAHDVTGLAAEMAYQFLFALFPFLIFLAAVVGLVGSLTGQAQLFAQLRDSIGQLAPPEVERVLHDWAEDIVYGNSPQLLTLGGLFALVGASAGVMTLSKGLNRAHGITATGPFWRQRATGILATVGMALAMVLGLLLYTVGEAAASAIAASLGKPELLVAWGILRALALGGGLFGVMFGVYVALPARRPRGRAALAGAGFAALLWIAATQGFSLYVTHLTSYDRTYGSLGLAALLLVWMYVVSLVLLLGAEISAELSGGGTRRA